MNGNIDLIKTEFTKQAPLFNAYQETDAKQAFNAKAIEQMQLNGSEQVLEIAAGTCALGRMIAPHVQKNTELDATNAMLADIHGESNTGFVRYLKDGQIMFNHKWGLYILK